MIYIKINDNLYPAVVSGRVKDRDWNDRESKYIRLEIGIEEVLELFKDGIGWSIVETALAHETSVDESGNTVMGELKEISNEYDNSDFCVLGDIVIHPDGTCTVAMGKETTEEKLLMMMYGGVE